MTAETGEIRCHGLMTIFLSLMGRESGIRFNAPSMSISDSSLLFSLTLSSVLLLSCDLSSLLLFLSFSLSSLLGVHKGGCVRIS